MFKSLAVRFSVGVAQNISYQNPGECKREWDEVLALELVYETSDQTFNFYGLQTALSDLTKIALLKALFNNMKQSTNVHTLALYYQ